MRRATMTAAIAVLLATGATAATEALAEARLADSQASGLGEQQQQIREQTCRYQWLDRGVWTDREERKTAECVVERFGVVGGLSTLLRVGNCESHWYRFAKGGYGGEYLGIFQHSAAYWPERVVHNMPDGWKVGPWTRWANPRSQIVTTVRMVNGAGGWSAWSCA